MAFALLIAGNAWAQDFDPCAGLTGKAKGLCAEYSKGMGCSSDSPNATPEACANAATMYEEVTGSPPPSDCPCGLSLDRIRDPIDGWDVAASYACIQTEFFDRTLPPLPFPSGSDFTIVSDLPSPTSDAEASVRLDAELLGGTGVVFLCEYRSARSSLRVVISNQVLKIEPGYADKVADLIDKYDACKGAIGILVANFPFDLSNNECSFD